MVITKRALNELKKLPKSEKTEELNNKIQDSLQKPKTVVVANNGSKTKDKVDELNPADSLKKKLEGYIQQKKFKALGPQNLRRPWRCIPCSLFSIMPMVWPSITSINTPRPFKFWKRHSTIFLMMMGCTMSSIGSWPMPIMH